MQAATKTLVGDDLGVRRVTTPTLLFFHIGKTGGTSVTHYFGSLARAFHVQSTPDDYSRLQAIDDTEFPDFISGHYPVHRWLPNLPRSWRTMAVIRDPIQHLLSSYWHIRTHPEVSDNLPLRQLIEDTKRFDFGTLLQMRTGEIFERHFDNPQARFILDKQFGPLDSNDLARASALLASVTYVGVTERLGEFVAQVATEVPWAADWRQQALPRMMVNPLNVLDTHEIPRALLHRILAATEIDAELHHQARLLQAERRPSGTRISGTVVNFQAGPASTTRAIPVVDFIRVSAVDIQNARLGSEFCINGNDIVLHPPKRASGGAAVAVEDMPLDGYSEIWGRLALAHHDAPPVVFGIEIRKGTSVVVSASFRVTRGQPIDVRLRFPPMTGSARLELRTEMALTNANDFAWATFIGLTVG